MSDIDIENRPLVSVVVTTKNEERCIAQCLQSIQDQSYSKLEIIVVDNNSTDRTCAIAAQFTDKIFNYGPERSAQRNYGMTQKSTGDFVMYMDADMTITPVVIAEAVDLLSAPDAPVAVYVPLRWVANNRINRLRGFEREFYDGTVLDAVRIIKRDVFLRSGGFDEELNAGEDWDFDRKIRVLGRVASIDAVMTHHEDPNFSLRDLISKISYYTPCIDRYRDRYGKDDPEIKRQFGLWYRFFYVFVENGKWRKILRHPCLFCGMYFLKIVMGLCYLTERK